MFALQGRLHFYSDKWGIFVHVRCPAERCERTCRFAGNSSFCHALACEVLTPTCTCTSPYCQFIICMFYLLECHTEQHFVFKYILQFLKFTMLILWEFLSFTSFCRKQAYNSLCQFCCRAPAFTSFCCAHNNFLVLWSCFQMTITLNHCAHYSCVLKQLDL